MSFLSGVVVQIIQWLLSKIGALILSAWQKFRREQEIEKKAEESVQPLKDAKSAEEIDKASRDALDGF